MNNSDSSKDNRKQVALTRVTRKTSDVFNRTIYGGQIWEITRYGKIVAVILPKSDEEKVTKELATK